MSPEQLCSKNTESGHQKALFAWAAMACNWGFDVANNMAQYNAVAAKLREGTIARPVHELMWLHAIPNGGARNAVTAARMKAEGARAGVYDIFLPVARRGYHGLYIEMKKPVGGRESDEQREFGIFIAQQGYLGVMCRSWRGAAAKLQEYLTAPPSNPWVGPR